MKKLVFLATAAGLFLVSNAPPPGPGPGPGAYPRCSATVTDNCIQRERGEPESRALDAMRADETSGARGGPYEPPPAAATTARRVYPPCSATVRDSCMQGRSHRARPVRYARRVRHAGERG
jgi:hypothetical protein